MVLLSLTLFGAAYRLYVEQFAGLHFRELTVVPGDLGVKDQRTCWSLTVSWGMLLVFLPSTVRLSF